MKRTSARPRRLVRNDILADHPPLERDEPCEVAIIVGGQDVASRRVLAGDPDARLVRFGW